MTDQEIKHLQGIVGDEYEVKRMNGSVVVDKKDIWAGVEFVECIKSCKGKITDAEIIEGEVYKINDVFKEVIYLTGFELGWGIEKFKPSTEQAYKNQLIKEAKEQFGEINEGDRFTRDETFDITVNNVDVFEYNKEEDSLSMDGRWLYLKGKWAEKVDNPIVKAEGGNIDSSRFYFIMNDPAKQKCRDIGCWEINVFLAQSLQDYLSKTTPKP